MKEGRNEGINKYVCVCDLNGLLTWANLLPNFFVERKYFATNSKRILISNILETGKGLMNSGAFSNHMLFISWFS